jgi:organic radical activating enzyme
MNKNKDTFCVAPWFQIRNSNKMDKNVCCAISSKITENIPSQSMSSLEYLNSEPILDLKKDLSNGIKSEHCSKCWIDEENGVTSLRQQLNSLLSFQKDFNSSNWMDVYFRKKNDFNSDIILSADIKVGNTCNYACVMCNPEDSSLIYANWMSDIDHPIVQSKLATDPDYLQRAKSFSFKNKQYIDYLNDIIENNKNIRFLKFLGGEPFLDKFLMDKLRELPASKKEKLSLIFVTNASKDFSDIIDSLGDFKYIQCSVSLEGIGEVQEWARSGSDWNQVAQNVLKAVNNSKIDMAVLYTFQTATVLGFADLAKWCKNNNIKLGANIVYNPKCLSVKTLPDNIKKNLLTDIVNNKNIINNTETSYEDLLVKVNDLEYDPSLRDDFFAYIEWYETNKNIKKLKNIFPELYR